MFKIILLLNPIYVTLFWSLVLNTNRVKGNIPKLFLGKFMIVAFFLYLSHFFYYLPLPEVYHYADPFYHLFNLLVYPMYYIYIRLLTVDDRFEVKKHSIFLILPLLIFVLYVKGYDPRRARCYLSTTLYKHTASDFPVSKRYLLCRLFLSCKV